MPKLAHPDRAYRGKLHVTVNNMGSKAYTLERGAIIVTVLFFRLAKAVHKDWLSRRDGRPDASPLPAYLGRLAPDFLDFERRATEIAEASAVKIGDDTVRHAQLWSGLLALIVTIVVGGSGLIAAALADRPFLAPSAIARLDKELAELRSSVRITEVKDDLAKLKSDLVSIKAAHCATTPQLQYCKSAPTATAPRR